MNTVRHKSTRRQRLRALPTGLILSSLVAFAVLTPAAALAAGDANNESCPAATEASPGFRSYLPDCRAYELVTPPYKQGFTESSGEAAVGETGADVLISSAGVVNGSSETPNLDKPNVYILQREAGEWRTVPIDPSATEFSVAAYLEASPSMDQTLWLLRRSPTAEAANFYVKQMDGGLVRVGPELPSPADREADSGGDIANFTASSANLSTVVFDIDRSETRDALWPEDGTVAGQSLYQYRSDDQGEPELVAVEGGPASTQLIGVCGVSLGGPHVQYNAISESGSRVFFTPNSAQTNNCGGKQPATNQIYVREDGSSTTLLSERSNQGCTGSCATSPQSDADYQGASSNGEKVIFTSTQQLLNGASEDEEDSSLGGCQSTVHPGGCNLYEYDFAHSQSEPALKLIAGHAEVQGVLTVSEDGSHVYFVAKGALPTDPNPEGASPVAGGNNLYVYERDAVYPTGHLAFVGELSSEDAEDWELSGIRPVQTTPDGKYLVFLSHAHLTSDDTSAQPEGGTNLQQLFEYADAEPEGRGAELARISVGRNGYDNDGNIAEPAKAPRIIEFNTGLVSRGQALSRLTMSADGARIVFASADSLVPEDTSGLAGECYSAYQYQSSGGIRHGTVSLVSDGTDVTTRGEKECGTYRAPLTDSSGEDIFFESGDSLVPRDTDTQVDLYDARVDGGNIEGGSELTCSGEACLGPRPPAVAVPIPQTSTAVPGDNVIPATIKSKSAPMSKTQKEKRALAKALKACQRDRKRTKRMKCESVARRRYKITGKGASYGQQETSGKGQR